MLKFVKLEKLSISYATVKAKQGSWGWKGRSRHLPAFLEALFRKICYNYNHCTHVEGKAAAAAAGQVGGAA